MNFLFAAASVVILTGLQWIFASAQLWFLKRVDLLLLGSLFFALNSRAGFALCVGLAMGFMKDIFCADKIFFNAACFGAAGWYIAHMKSKLYKDSGVTQSILSLSVSVAAFTLFWVVLKTQSRAPSFFEALRFVIIPASAVTALFAPLFFFAMDRFRLKIRI